MIFKVERNIELKRILSIVFFMFYSLDKLEADRRKYTKYNDEIVRVLDIYRDVVPAIELESIKIKAGEDEKEYREAQIKNLEEFKNFVETQLKLLPLDFQRDEGEEIDQGLSMLDLSIIVKQIEDATVEVESQINKVEDLYEKIFESAGFLVELFKEKKKLGDNEEVVSDIHRELKGLRGYFFTLFDLFEEKHKTLNVLEKANSMLESSMEESVFWVWTYQFRLQAH